MSTCVYVYQCLCMYVDAHTHRHAERLRSLRALAAMIAASPCQMLAAGRSSAFRLFVHASLLIVAMGKRAASGSAARRGRDGAAKDDEKTKHPRAVPLWKLFVKSSLRSWPDENGCMLLTERKSPAAYFTGAKVKEIASSETSLCVSKPAMGVSLTAASLEACAAAMAVMPRTAEKAYARTGIPAARSCLEPLEKAIGASNLNNKAYEDKKGAAKHVEKLLTTLGAKEGHAARMKSFAQLADAGSRLYAGGMAALEMGALARDPRSWAKCPTRRIWTCPCRGFSRRTTCTTWPLASRR